MSTKYAFRSLRKNLGFSLIVILTLGFGMGANAAIFSLMDQVLLRRLPVRDPSQLVFLDGPGAFQGRTFNRMTFSYPMYKDFRDRNEVFSGLLARFPTAMTIAWEGRSERINGDIVSGNYFDVLGVRPALGRVFNDSDDRTPGAHPVAVLSYGFWQRRFGGDPAVLDRTLVVNGHPMTIVGVSAAGFNGIQVGSNSDVVVPMMMKAQMTPTWNDLDNRRSRWVTIMGRLKPGVTAEAAEVQLNVVYKPINEEEVKAIPNASETFRQRFVSKHLDVLTAGTGISDMRTQFSTPLVVLMCMVGVVLLIACANVANLLLARSTSRQKEIAVRLALGASRARIARQHFIESLILAGAGAVVGLVLAVVTGRLLLAALPGDPASQALTASPDLRVVAFTLLLALVTALIFGIGPALSATRPAVVSALKDEAGSVVGGGRQARVRRALVVGQVALSMLLLAGAGLFAQKPVQPACCRCRISGREPAHVFDRSDAERLRAARMQSLFEQTQDALTAIPGVRSASMSEIGAFTGNEWGQTVKIDGYQPKEDEDMNPHVDGIGPRYFETLGVPLVSGREFKPSDTLGAPKVAIINETMAKQFYGNTSPVGRRMGFGRSNAIDIEIVGVARDLRTVQLNQKPVRFVYIPYRQDDSVTQLTYVASIQGKSRHRCRSCSSGRAASRSQPADLRSQDDDGAGVRVPLHPAHGRGAFRDVRRAGDDAGGDWALRRDVLCGGAAHARDRNPHGARRRARQGDVARVERGGGAGGDWRRGRPRGGFLPDAAGAIAALRALAARSGDAHRRRGAAPARGAGGRLRAGTARDGYRSARRIESRVAGKAASISLRSTSRQAPG